MQRLQIEYLWSAVIWIPYSCLLLYLVREQVITKRYPQNAIMLLFAMGCCCRCVWFFGAAFDLRAKITFTILNRIAILFQFSGFSLLILMWARVVRARRITVVSEDLNQRSENDEIQSSKSRQQRLNTVRAVVGLNVVTWLGMIVTIILANKSVVEVGNTIYNYNILLIGEISFVLAVIVFVVGLLTAIRISRELEPRYVTGIHNNADTRAAASSASTGVFFTDVYKYLFTSESSQMSRQGRLQTQKEAMRRIVVMSSIASFFMLVRSVTFALGFYCNT